LRRDTVALFASVLSLLVAAFALGWNVYRDVVLKPHLRVRLSIVDIVTPGVGSEGTYVNVTGTNFGPGVLTVNLVWGRATSWLQRLLGNRAHLVVLKTAPDGISTNLPARIDVGEKVELLFPYDADCVLKEPLTRIGLTDSFGRRHSAPRKDIREAIAKFAKDFGST